jgi:hypothetical protein
MLKPPVRTGGFFVVSLVVRLMVVASPPQGVGLSSNAL